jgi:hypothetical protein
MSRTAEVIPDRQRAELRAQLTPLYGERADGLLPSGSRSEASEVELAPFETRWLEVPAPA